MIAVGKSRLAEQLAQALSGSFEQGALVVALAAVNDVAVIPVLIAEALGESLEGAQAPADQLTALLAGRRLLLALDNFEQFLNLEQGDAAVRLIEQLLAYTDVSLLITSRERLRLSAESVFELDGLSIPPPEQVALLKAEQLADFDAIMLFLERARQTDRQFTLNPANMGHVAQICTLLQGMPLGIELAAAWVRTLSPAEIADEMARSIDFLTLANRNVPARHHSMRAVFDHSWQLLGTEERRALARLSVFRGSLDREAAGAVADISLPILAALVDKSLVRSSADTTGPQRAYRYSLHELLRQYLADRLEEAGDVSQIRQRHARHYTRLAEQAAAHLLPNESRVYRSMLEENYGNLLAALHWCLDDGNDPELGLRLAGALGRFWYFSEQWREGTEWLRRALRHPSADDAARATALTRRAELSAALSEFSSAAADFQESIALWRQANQPDSLAWALFQAGGLFTNIGETDRALAYFAESLELYRVLGERVQIAMVQMHRGAAVVTNADYDAAAEMLEESVPIFRESRSEGSLAVALNLLGRTMLGQGHTERAIELFNEALSISQHRKSREGIAWGYLNLGLAHMIRGHSRKHAVASAPRYRKRRSSNGAPACWPRSKAWGSCSPPKAPLHPLRACCRPPSTCVRRSVRVSLHRNSNCVQEHSSRPVPCSARLNGRRPGARASG